MVHPLQGRYRPMHYLLKTSYDEHRPGRFLVAVRVSPGMGSLLSRCSGLLTGSYSGEHGWSSDSPSRKASLAIVFGKHNQFFIKCSLTFIPFWVPALEGIQLNYVKFGSDVVLSYFHHLEVQIKAFVDGSFENILYVVILVPS